MSLVVNTGAAARASQAPQAQQPTSGTSPITPQTRSASRSSAAHGSRAGAPGTSTSQHPRGSGAPQPQPTVQKPSPEAVEPEDSRWAANFWVTLVDPQTQNSFFACPATGDFAWEPPLGSFVLPPSEEGEWWELVDESRGGIPYYYQTKTLETVWERPAGFVIPLSILQDIALVGTGTVERSNRHSFFEKPLENTKSHLQIPPSNRPVHANPQRKSTSDQGPPSSNRLHPSGTQLAPIPGSPYATEQSEPPSPTTSTPSIRLNPENDQTTRPESKESSGKSRQGEGSSHHSDHSVRAKSTTAPHRPQQPQSLDVALEQLEHLSVSEANKGKDQPSRARDASHYLSDSTQYELYPSDNTPPASMRMKSRDIPPSPSRAIPDVPPALFGGKPISSPILNHAATLQMRPVLDRDAGHPIAVEHIKPRALNASTTTLRSGVHPTFPDALVSDIQLFSQSEYARQYFSTHKSGFIFKRRIPVEQLMSWQKAALTSPLLLLNRALHKNAVKIFRVVQLIMGDREKERPTAGRAALENSAVASSSSISSMSLLPSNNFILEEERWLLTEGLLHGELRDEIYCQLMKQLSGNTSTESVFKGWQLLCVLLVTFPPSKDFETYLESFIQKHTNQQKGRIDVMAKYCIRQLSSISRKGPRGKPPSISEIEIAADAAFNPSTFGESLDAIIRLQERNYPQQKVPIILPFLADGILALGGLRAEGIFRVAGDNESLSALKLRIDRGYYTLETVDDPHVLASLMKLWLRELCDPLIPSEMYNECIMRANDPGSCIQIVHRLPTINRRVVLFVISFMQIFLDEKTQSVTKMTPANLALVMAPNLLRCTSDSMAVVFTNSQFEQIFVYHLLLHLKCDEIDPAYKPTHGLGAASTSSKTRLRRPT